MGFSTFGAKPHHAAKKRKLVNDSHHKDPGLDLIRGSGSGSGSNGIPLGCKRGGTSGDGDRNMRRDGEERGDAVVRDVDIETDTGTGVERWIGKSSEELAEEVDNKQGKELEIPDSNEATRISSSGIPHFSENGASRLTSSTRIISKPARDTESTTSGATTSRKSYTNDDFAALRRGVRNHNGDVAYYDASFVEDPWKGLR